MTRRLYPLLAGILFVFMMSFVFVPSAGAGDAEAILKLKNEIIQKQNKGRLGVQEFALCTKVLNYASFYPKQDNKIKRGTKLLLYYEPINWFTSTQQGRYEFYLTQDVILESAAGEVLFKRDGLLSMHYNTGKPILDIYMTNDFSLGNLPAGKYRYIIVLHDMISGQQFKRGIQFELVE
ncbi:hypothetical protein [Desulfovibrio sp. JC010]|uniref:hypothetical protein n=1 Tax=Desulfovibrio sp. JC010 TaxID=2593641 RepID=UPI0013D29F42|nr:hypothetical protein [Desulfovibrio sp. JC010]NDV27592.1 hypothetical protein [Desulfovibrio sp. JC010]